ncbi:MAG: cell division protein ZapA [Acidobacteria bacterium]|nr:cell division protein ZapA [Acidobacteriota bacterium]
MATTSHIVSVEIHGHRYPIHSSLDQEYVVRLAEYVDERMRAATEATPNADAVRLAVLTALNIADELFRARDANRDRNGRLIERAGEIERMLDRLLMA